jgi:PAS domain S-box-containing protein
VPDARPPPSDAEQFRLLVECVKDYAIFMLTPEGRVATWNAGAEAIKGYRAEDIIGQHFSRFYEREAIERGWPEHELAMARATGRFEDEGWRLRKDGSRFWASVVITALHDRTGTLCGFAKVTRDLTARRQVEELQRSERRMSEFLAILAHELRNPLAPMLTALEISQRAGNDVEAREYAQELFARQLTHLTHLVDGLLDLGRITTGRIEFKRESVDFGELAREAVSCMRPLFDAKRQSLTVRMPSRPAMLEADPTRIVQVVTNLLANANKYTPEDGHIGVSLEHDEGFALLQVTDDGCGIPAPLLAMVFEAFVQGERALDRQGAGLGIGLTLVRRLVEAHGGTVAAASPGPGLGSTFSVRLPLREPNLAAGAMGAAVRPPRALHVLVVDDNRDIALSTAMLLRMLGHEVEVAHDGPQALLRAKAQRPEVVLLDIGLPTFDGFEVARALRADPATRHASIVACTGYGRDDDRKRAAAAGFDRLAVKPVGADTLDEILEHAVRRAAGAAQSGSNNF